MAQPLDTAKHPLSTDKTSKRLMTASCWIARARPWPRSYFAARPPSYRRGTKTRFRQSLRPAADLPFVVTDSKRRSRLCLLAPQRKHERPAASSIPMLAQEDALPGAKEQSPIADRNRHRRSHQRRLDVGGHVVGPFDGVHVRKILRRELVERALQIDPHIVVRIFVDRDRGRRVLNECLQYSHANLRELGQRLDDFARDKMTAAGATRQRNFPLKPDHRCILKSKVSSPKSPLYRRLLARTLSLPLSSG